MNVVNVGVQERLMKENYKWYEIIENHKIAAVTGVTGELTTYGCSFLMECLYDLLNVFVRAASVPDNRKNAIIVLLYKEESSKMMQKLQGE